MQAVKEILSRYVQPEVKGNALRPRLVEGDGRTLLCVFNDDPYADHNDQIGLPHGFGRAVRLFDGKEAIVNDGVLSLELEADDAAVLELLP